MNDHWDLANRDGDADDVPLSARSLITFSHNKDFDLEREYEERNEARKKDD